MKVEPQPYKSPVAFTPGEIMQDILLARMQGFYYVLGRSGLKLETFCRLLRNEEPITPEIADALEKGFGIKASFWLNAQRQYDETRARLAGESGGD